MARRLRRDERAVLEALAAQAGAVTVVDAERQVVFAAGGGEGSVASVPAVVDGAVWRLEVPAAGGPCARVAAAALERLAAARSAVDDYAAATRRLWSEQNVLFTAGEVLGEGFGEAEIASWLAERLGVVPARAVTVMAWDGAELRHAAGDPAAGLPAGVLAGVLEEGEPAASVVRCGNGARAPGGDTPVLVVPLRHAGRVLGAAAVRRSAGEGAFSSEEVKLAQLLADLASVALANRVLIAEAGRTARLQRDLELAAEIQQQLLPARRARYGALDVAARCEPMAWVGGDGYVHRRRPGAPVAVAVLDVAGHGVAASLALAALTARLETLVDVVTSPGDLLSVLNRGMLLNRRGGPRLVTAAVAFVHPEAGTLQFASAGHPPGLVFRGGGVEDLGLGGPPLGAAWDAEYPVREDALHSGDTLLLYSDGVSEVLGAGDALAGVEAVKALPLAGAGGVGDVVDRLMEAVALRRTGVVEDDTTVLAVRRVEVTDA